MNRAKRVLIVEDDAHIANLLRMHLRDEGYDVTHAASGEHSREAESSRLSRARGFMAMIIPRQGDCWSTLIA